MSGATVLAELDRIFHPKSVALLGASNKEGKIGRMFMERFLEMGFEQLYPVNPGESEILGVKAYRTVADIPDSVDLAIVVTPKDSVLAAVKECASKKVRGIVITTSGFGETGEKGRELEQELVRIARESGTRIIGPNCVGIYCPSSRLPFPLGPGKESGSVGVISQSGFFADFLTLTATGNGIAFSKAVSCGNESDLNAIDFFEYLGEDPQTQTIVSYLEGTKDGRRFYHISKEISKRKPIILWKGGRTEAGARAVVSHTGALAGSRRVWDGALRQAGIISVKSFEEALDCLYAFHLQPLPKGRRVGIISGPGGTAVGTTDRCLELGLEVPALSMHTIERLKNVLPPVGGSVNNPIDVGLASLVAPAVYRDAIRIAAEDEGIDMLLVIANVGGKLLRDLILEATSNIELRKPLVVTVMGGPMQSVAQDFPLFLGSGISVYLDAARAAKALAMLWEHAQFRARGSAVQKVSEYGGRDNGPSGRGTDAIETALREGRTILSEHESKKILQAYGIPVTQERETTDEQGFKQALTEIGFPLVIKGGGADVGHKTERGLVYTDIRNQQEAMTAFEEIMKKANPGGGSILVQEMIKGTRELVAGFVRDVQFGPCVMFGLGGILTEIFQDISFRVAPIEKSEALDMIGEMKARNILEAVRGMPAADIDQLADIVMKVGKIGLEHPHIKEIDINPIILSKSGPIVADALIVLEK